MRSWWATLTTSNAAATPPCSSGHAHHYRSALAAREAHALTEPAVGSMLSPDKAFKPPLSAAHTPIRMLTNEQCCFLSHAAQKCSLYLTEGLTMILRHATPRAVLGMTQHTFITCTALCSQHDNTTTLTSCCRVMTTSCTATPIARKRRAATGQFICAGAESGTSTSLPICLCHLRCRQLFFLSAQTAQVETSFA